MKDHREELEELALDFIAGKPLTELDLFGLAATMKIDLIKYEFLPGPKTISGSPKARKKEIFRLAEAIWGIKPEGWLVIENLWLSSAREKSGSRETGGKDNLDDVISAELLIRMTATIKLVDIVEQESVRTEAVNALNLALNEAVSKGRTRIKRVAGKTIYSILKDAGVMIGTGGGKYLPDPETSLPDLFQMLNWKRISNNAYR